MAQLYILSFEFVCSLTSKLCIELVLSGDAVAFVNYTSRASSESLNFTYSKVPCVFTSTAVSTNKLYHRVTMANCFEQLDFGDGWLHVGTATSLVELLVAEKASYRCLCSLFYLWACNWSS